MSMRERSNMDEKRLVEHANDYIKQMARGVNPLTGEILDDNDLINDVRISRCLFYVSEILSKYYDSLKKSGNSVRRKKKFYASYNDLINFDYSIEPIYISVLTDKINAEFNSDTMRKLPTTAISNWLVANGYLVVYTKDDGKNSKKPTSLGEELGIKQVIKEGVKGPYVVNTYNINAQRYIINNIEEISKSIQ